ALSARDRRISRSLGVGRQRGTLSSRRAASVPPLDELHRPRSSPLSGRPRVSREATVELASEILQPQPDQLDKFRLESESGSCVGLRNAPRTHSRFSYGFPDETSLRASA